MENWGIKNYKINVCERWVAKLFLQYIQIHVAGFVAAVSKN